MRVRVPGTPPGHQVQRPNNAANAGSSTVLTTKVSINTPTDTANPNSTSPIISPDIMAANVPARIIPAEVMIAPVVATAI